MAVTSLIGLVAAKFSEKLNAKSFESGNKGPINELITNVFFEVKYVYLFGKLNTYL